VNVTVISYSEKGMTRVMYTGHTVYSGEFKIVSRKGLIVESPSPGDLFDTAIEAVNHFEAMGHEVKIAPSQGAGVHPGL
jgi:hypothetical protein